MPVLPGNLWQNTSVEIAASAKQDSPPHWQICKEYADSYYTYILSNSIRIRLYNQIMQATTQVIQYHENMHVR
jgi:hypothetical protein